MSWTQSCCALKVFTQLLYTFFKYSLQPLSLSLTIYLQNRPPQYLYFSCALSPLGNTDSSVHCSRFRATAHKPVQESMLSGQLVAASLTHSFIHPWPSLRSLFTHLNSPTSPSSISRIFLIITNFKSSGSLGLCQIRLKLGQSTQTQWYRTDLFSQKNADTSHPQEIKNRKNTCIVLQ